MTKKSTIIIWRYIVLAMIVGWFFGFDNMAEKKNWEWWPTLKLFIWEVMKYLAVWFSGLWFFEWVHNSYGKEWMKDDTEGSGSIYRLANNLSILLRHIGAMLLLIFAAIMGL